MPFLLNTKVWHEYAKHACSSKLRFYSFDLIFLGSIFHYAVISNMILYSSLLDLLYGFRLKVCAGSLLFSKITSCWLAGNYGFKKSKFTCKLKFILAVYILGCICVVLTYSRTWQIVYPPSSLYCHLLHFIY